MRMLAILMLLPTVLFAQTEINVRGSGRLFPIAVPDLCLKGAGSDVSKEIPKTIGRDLDLSGYFELISPGAYIETPGKCASEGGFAYSDWSVIGAEGLVRGVVTVEENQIRAQLYLHDVQRQTMVLGKEYAGDISQAKKIAHRFANEVMKFFTGEAGIFGSQIAYSSRVGRFKELFVMDMDGTNIKQLTSDKGLALSPSWDPSGTKLIYTAYKNRIPDLFVMNALTQQVSQITRGPALEIGGKFGQSDGVFVASRSMGDDSDLVVLGRDGSILKRITTGGGSIEVSPVHSPDYSKILFCSNRSGGPQIYMMNSDGSDAHRISFVSSNYCTSPAWSPKGDRIAFVCRADIGFQMFVANPDGSSAIQVTSSGDNEDPDFSPDGRYIAFATTFGRPGIFSLALMRSDGSSMKQLTQSRGGDFEPTWGPVQ